MNLFNEHRFAFLLQIVVVVGFLGWLFWSGAPEITNGHASLTFDFGDSRRTFEGRVVGGMTVLDALRASVAAGGMAFAYSLDDQRQVSAVTVDGKNCNAENCQIYVNGSTIPLNQLNSTLVKGGDIVEISFLK